MWSPERKISVLRALSTAGTPVSSQTQLTIWANVDQDVVRAAQAVSVLRMLQRPGADLDHLRLVALCAEFSAGQAPAALVELVELTVTALELSRRKRDRSLSEVPFRQAGPCTRTR